ncbi:TPA: hypothetical protein ACT195_002717 [Raoultella planticola]|mgnify:CR=1 FL=1|jgi:hypothetical protein|uniref:hypothetical protein n=1 Tax=Enterobacteriaceae TaxID=543 RepID=UPI00103F8544|nr:hypothetical protein [Citrobacter braakii]EBB2298583.1 hypothetical protein [Salmonella enterica]EBH6389475.1 hypothetical protein [Salmonella enterica]ECW3427993.1 hypothetical protein [Salmonella enterica]EDI9672378.1 hypothetical protein [Salmonella enterica]EDZ3692792.1 hypothetical protein [Salmonella enterica]
MKIPLARLSDKNEALAEALPKFETVVKVRAEKCFRVKSLQKCQGKVYQDLFKKLKDCHPSDPCGSAACPECFRKHRLEMIGEVLRLCKKSKKWRSITLIFYQDAFYDNQLLKWQPDTLIARLRRWLNECGFSGIVIGGFEMDYHIDIKKWMPHFHLIIPNDKQAIKRLRIRMKNKKNMNTRGNVINRPMLVSKLKAPLRQVSYRFKAIWWRVESIQYDDYHLQGNKERKRKRWTKKYRLLRNQYVDSLIKLDSIGITGLTFMYKVRKYGDHLIMK